MGKVVALCNMAVYFFKNFVRFRLAHDNHYHITKHKDMFDPCDKKPILDFSPM